MGKIREEKIRSFVDYIGFLETECQDDALLFRGQISDVPLLPKIARLKFPNGALEGEREMFEVFKRQALPYLSAIPESDWDWLAIAQHHGMATRLLDWTLNPLAALWFAVGRPPQAEQPGVVWILESDPELFVDPAVQDNPFDGETIRIVRPRHLSRRIVTQSGWFTSHNYLARGRRWYPLQEIDVFKPRLIKLIVDAGCFADLRWSLDRAGVNSASMFPDIDGLCHHIEWQNSLMEDEGE